VGQPHAGAEIRQGVVTTLLFLPVPRIPGEQIGQRIHDHLLVPQYCSQHLFLFACHVFLPD
jgi:hypothetical protein